MVISPFAKKNFVDHTQTDQASILRFIEDNWDIGRIGDASADAWAGSMRGLFSFDESQAPPLYALLRSSRSSASRPWQTPRSLVAAGAVRRR